ncbi:MAG: acyltransferase, partial [Oricola sp.]
MNPTGVMAAGAPPSQEIPKLNVLQAGRGLAASAVLLFHANIIYARQLADEVVPFKVLSVGSAGVEYFFVLSGFIMTLVHRRDLGVPSRVSRYAMARLVRIFPAFWVVFSLFLAAEFVLGLKEESLTGPGSYLWAYALLPFDGSSPLTAAWTLSHELLFYLVFGLAILNRAFGFAVICVWTTTCAAATVGRLTGLVDLSYPASFLLADYNILFAFGILSALAFRSLRLDAAKGVLAAGVLVFAIAAWLVVAHGVPDLAVVFGVSAALVITALVRFETAGSITVPRWLVQLGDASYSVYLIHGPAMVVVAMVLRKIGLGAGLGPFGTVSV